MQIFKFWGETPIIETPKRHFIARKRKFLGAAPEIWAEIWASEKVDWVGRNRSPIFAVCGPEFTKFGRHVGVWLQFSTPFSDRRHLVPVRRYSRSNRKIRNFEVFGRRNFWGEGPPNFWLNFKNYSHHRTCGKVWWRSAQRPPRLEDSNISSKI